MKRSVAFILGVVLSGGLIMACGGGDGDHCAGTCMDEGGGVPDTCGNGVVDVATETCDDGNRVSGDGCDATCRIEVQCGDGRLTGQEHCDDGNTAFGDGCSPTCAVEAGYKCSGVPSVCTSVPGEGTCAAPYPVMLAHAGASYVGTGSGDTGDSTNQVSGAACDVQTSDGDGPDQIWSFTNPIAQPVLITLEGAGLGFDGLIRLTTTACDASTGVPDDLLADDTHGQTDGCADLHGKDTSEHLWYANLPAGVYYVTVDGFSGTDKGTYAFKVEAGTASCGNSAIEIGETCDDGNPAGGDGCSATCTVEAGYHCTAAAPSVCTRTCGNGDLDAGEECDSGGVANARCTADCHLVHDLTDTEANNTAATAQVVTPGHHIIEGSLPAGDLDVFKVTVTVPSVIELETYTTYAKNYVTTSTNTTSLGLKCEGKDTQVRVFASTADPTSDAAKLYYDDDDGDGVCSYLGPRSSTTGEGKVAAGTYYVTIHEFGSDDPIDRYLLDLNVTPQ